MQPIKNDFIEHLIKEKVDQIEDTEEFFDYLFDM